MIKFVLEGETPAKKNSKVMNTKTHRLFPSIRYQEWHTKAMSEILTQKFNLREEFPMSNVAITLQFYHGDNRRRDSDNGVSSIFDLLVDCGVITDDCWQVIKHHEVINYANEKSFVIIIIDKLN